MMRVGLASGTILEVDDDSYVLSDDLSGTLTRIFTSKSAGRMFTIKDENIEYLEEKWTADRLAGYTGNTPYNGEEETAGLFG